jgi:hypothetical protein
VAYEAYFEDCGGLSINGELLPAWGDQRQAIREHWDVAGQAVARRLKDDIAAGRAIP